MTLTPSTHQLPKGPGNGIAHLARGFRLLWVPGIRRFVWIPLCINIAVFATLGWLAYGQFEQWLESISVLERFSDWWIVSAFTTVLRWIAGLLLVFVFTYAYTLLANLIGAPFNSFLSERVELHLTGQTPQEPFSINALLRSVPSTMWSEVRKITYMLVWLVPLLILHVIPVINLIAPLLLFIFGAWMYAVEYVDHPMGNHGYKFAEIRRILRQHRTAALGFGLPVALLSMVPVVNLFVMPWAVAAATVFYVRTIKPGISTQK